MRIANRSTYSLRTILMLLPLAAALPARSLTILILLGLALLVVGVVSSRITSRYLQSQFATLKGDAMRLSAGGVPHAQDSRILELRELGQALREAAVRLTEAQSGRERAMQALQQADQRKDEFLSILAHELRNPWHPCAMPLHCCRNAPETT